MTFAQMQNACDALGVPRGNVRSLRIEAHGPEAGVTVGLAVRDRSGRWIAAHDHTALVAYVHLPIELRQEVTTDGPT
ncbi:hypothetical protein ACSMX9_22630 [Streptomyces sp. LE64]|uniref:hypothetical protein n=1 Tax=Streptomyces sp. LE64 TaxID=3448653 RepID=UPI004042AFBA